MPRESDFPKNSRLTKRIKDANGALMDTTTDNLLTDTRVYEVEYLDGCTQLLAVSVIAMGMFAQVNAEGNINVLFDQIIDHRAEDKNVKRTDSFITSSNGSRRRIETTKRWEILLQWKDESSEWEAFKDMKECYPVQLCECSLGARMSDEAMFTS